MEPRPTNGGNGHHAHNPTSQPGHAIPNLVAIQKDNEELKAQLLELKMSFGNLTRIVEMQQDDLNREKRWREEIELQMLRERTRQYETWGPILVNALVAVLDSRR
jgi:hypothetical protein